MKTITLRLLEPVEMPDNWIELKEVTCVRNAPLKHFSGARYVEVNPIPEGYEVCHLSKATKVKIGDTFLDVNKEGFVKAVDIHASALDGFGVLAIRPIPEPEPMRGEADVHSFDVTHGFVSVPVDLIGKRIRWEVIE